MESQNAIESLFLYSSEGIVVTDENGEILVINPSTERFFGYNINELIGKKIEVLIPERYAHKHIAERKHYNEKPWHRAMGSGMQLFGLRKDGTEFPVEISLSPYTNGDRKFVIAYIIDVSLRKKAEENLKYYSSELEKQVKQRTRKLEETVSELKKTRNDLNNALEKERELSELKSRFVSMASHEFRTPLATILSSLSLVTKYGELNEKEKQDKHIARIKSSISNMTDILNDFLSVSKLEEGKEINAPENINLPKFIEDISREMEMQLQTQQVINISHKGKEIVYLDKRLLKNILFNLISNAIKFSPDGKPIEVNTQLSGKQIIITVEDNGIGISKDDQKHLFERFFRGKNVSHIQGTGLGLNIVSKYAELMKGTVQLVSKENKGTTVTLIFSQ